MSNNKNHCPMGTTPYTVKQGDTFYLIAKRENISLDALLKVNPGIDPNRLFIGQIICIPSSAPGPGPGPSHPCPTLAQGSRGPYVTDLQTRLNSQGFNPGVIDGIFGPNTKAAVMAFQKSKGLVQDGIVGVKTWTALGVNCGTIPPTKCPAGTFPHTIKSGETFFILASRYNVSVESILKANPGVNPNALQIGQVVCIPNK